MNNNKKELIMNKITKLGVTALCGSLAAVSSANAGSLSAAGGIDMSWVSMDDENTGNPIGIGSNYTLKGSGELDNGWTFDVSIANGNLRAYSAANITLDMGGLGKLNFNQGNSGNGIAAIDDSMPTAWEESWGAGLSTYVRLPLGSGASDNVMYTTPTLLGTTLTFTYAPDYGTSDTADKTTANTGDENAESYDATININPSFGTEILSGLNVFAGASTIARENFEAANDDAYEVVGGGTFDLGPVSLGVQWSADYTGAEDSFYPDATSVVNLYKAVAYGVAFNVNDDLSLSYGQWEAQKAGVSSTAANEGTNSKTSGVNRLKVTSLQAAYTMGGASFRIADTEAENVAWTNGDNRGATTLSIGLAF